MLQMLAVPVAAVVSLAIALSSQCVVSYNLSDGVGDPWGTALDQRGNVWFAEAGCDFEVNCTAATPPGQIGVLRAGTDGPRFYTLPAVPGNQPIFVEPDPAGVLWFTTPNNSSIGAFDPVTETFLGQWPVTPATGPWDLVWANGAIWYTERFGSAIGRFDPVAKTHVDVRTPTPDTHPYGIAANGTRIWFAENNGAVARIASLDTARANRIDEYQLRAALPGSLTPHMLSVDESGGVWWSAGWTRVIGRLDPSRVVAGACGASVGNCAGVTEYRLPDPPPDCHQSHVSGIAVQPGSSRVWLTDSLSGEVGYFDRQSNAFTLRRVHDCNAHSHDGLSADGAGHVWWTEEFADALNTLAPPG